MVEEERKKRIVLLRFVNSWKLNIVFNLNCIRSICVFDCFVFTWKIMLYGLCTLLTVSIVLLSIFASILYICGIAVSSIWLGFWAIIYFVEMGRKLSGRMIPSLCLSVSYNEDRLTFQVDGKHHLEYACLVTRFTSFQNLGAWPSFNIFFLINLLCHCFVLPVQMLCIIGALY